MNKYKYLLLLALIATFTACDKKNKGLVKPLVENDFPQIITLADEGDGDLEDEDKFSFVITLADKVDPQGKELGGKVVPLAQDVVVHFKINGIEGISSIESYIKEATAFYEVDDCNTEDVKITFDSKTGLGTVTFPKGVEEVEIEFETDPDAVEDDMINGESRMVQIKLTSVDANGQKVVVNTDNTFEYRILDDEGIYGEYELNIDDKEQFENFIQLFGLVNEDVRNLSVDDVEEMLVAFEYGEFKAIVVLKETEEVDECGEVETVNKEIEIEADLTSLDDEALAGNVEIEGAIEADNGSETEFTYEGGFTVNGKVLELTLQGEMKDDKTGKTTLTLEK